MGHGMVAASCVILIDLVIQIVSSFPRPVPVPGLVGVSTSAQRLTNGEFRLLWVGFGTPASNAHEHRGRPRDCRRRGGTRPYWRRNSGRHWECRAWQTCCWRRLHICRWLVKVKIAQDFRPNGGQPALCSCSCIHGRLAAASIANGEETHVDLGSSSERRKGRCCPVNLPCLPACLPASGQPPDRVANRIVGVTDRCSIRAVCHRPRMGFDINQDRHCSGP